MLSEVGYYLSRPDLSALRARLADAVTPGGHLVMVYWTGESDCPLTADTVHDAFLRAVGWAAVDVGGGTGYHLDVLARWGASG